MNAIFIGDIVGREAVDHVVGRLPSLCREHEVGLVVANAENCRTGGYDHKTGFGMSMELVERLFEGGVDVITSGNHAWDSPESDRVHDHPRVLRPLNMPEGTAGKGVLSLEIEGETVTVVNLGSASAIPKATPVYPAWLSSGTRGTVVVDFHGDSVLEKQTFAFAVDGQAAAVLGTHTHEPTLPLHLLPGGTALVTDVGMTGPLGGLAGIDPERLVAEWITGEGTNNLAPFKLAAGSITLGAVLLRIEEGKTKEIERLS